LQDVLTEVPQLVRDLLMSCGHFGKHLVCLLHAQDIEKPAVACRWGFSSCRDGGWGGLQAWTGSAQVGFPCPAGSSRASLFACVLLSFSSWPRANAPHAAQRTSKAPDWALLHSGYVYRDLFFL